LRLRGERRHLAALDLRFHHAQNAGPVLVGVLLGAERFARQLADQPLGQLKAF
jgi:hypothetical protein